MNLQRPQATWENPSVKIVPAGRLAGEMPRLMPRPAPHPHSPAVVLPLFRHPRPGAGTPGSLLGAVATPPLKVDRTMGVADRVAYHAGGLGNTQGDGLLLVCWDSPGLRTTSPESRGPLSLVKLDCGSPWNSDPVCFLTPTSTQTRASQSWLHAGIPWKNI